MYLLVDLFEYLFIFWLHWQLLAKQAINSQQSAKPKCMKEWWFERFWEDIDLVTLVFSFIMWKIPFTGRFLDPMSAEFSFLWNDVKPAFFLFCVFLKRCSFFSLASFFRVIFLKKISKRFWTKVTDKRLWIIIKHILYISYV